MSQFNKDVALRSELSLTIGSTEEIEFEDYSIQKSKVSEAVSLTLAIAQGKTYEEYKKSVI